MGCGCSLSQSQKDARRYKQIASRLPLNRGSVITPEGTVIDICDIIGVSKSPMDPQLARSQDIYPYIRDTVILENGQVCSLVEIVQKFLAEFLKVDELEERLDNLVIYTEDLRLEYCTLTEGDWISGS